MKGPKNHKLRNISKQSQTRDNQSKDAKGQTFHPRLFVGAHQ
jgi:hypothetical protein